MRKKTVILFLALCSFVIVKGQVSQSYNPSSIQMEWKLVKNISKSDSLFNCSITFTNKGNKSMPSAGWKIYFNLRYHGYKLTSLNNAFEIKHVSGELFCITPAVGFKGLTSRQTINIGYTGTERIANYQDIPSGLFWVNHSKPGIGIPLHPLLIGNTGSLPVADESSIYKKNSEIENIPQKKLPKIFPTPLECHELPGNFLLNENTCINAGGSFMNETNYLADQIQKLTGKRPLINGPEKPGNTIVFKKVDLKPGAYKLEINNAGIKINAADGAGIFYGIQSIKSLLPANAWASKHTSLKIPAIEVNDAPQFATREFMLDVSRNFQPKQEILRILDLMSLYKLNVFHFHLTDDEGWRLAIPGLPELTDVGARRGYPFSDNHQLHPSYGSGPDAAHSHGSGYYSKEQFIEILKYATERHILVIPEIESPGHARAAVKAMTVRYNKYIKSGNKVEAEKYLLYDLHDKSVYLSNQGFNDNVMDVALPSTYSFMEKVIDEIRVMYKAAGAPLTMMHVGGDEVPNGCWAESPAALELMHRDLAIKNTKDLWRNYFQKIGGLLKARGIFMSGWQELAAGTQNAGNSDNLTLSNDFTRDSVRLDAWWFIAGKDDAGYKLANAGYKVVLCPFDYFYLDLAYNKSFNEPGDSWIGYLDAEKIFSFNPYDYYKYTTDDIMGKPLPPNYFGAKEQLTKAGKDNIVGLQAAMWEENIGTPRLLEYMLLPRLLAMAERAWAKQPGWALDKDSIQSKKDFQQDWSVFVNVLAKNELPKLDFYGGGYNFRVPTAGVITSNGKVMANCELPGFIIRYTFDGSAPTARSPKYIKPLSEKGTISFRVFDDRGRHGETVSIFNK
jgi:hexosaminidase